MYINQIENFLKMLPFCFLFSILTFLYIVYINKDCISKFYSELVFRHFEYYLSIKYIYNRKKVCEININLIGILSGSFFRK